MTIKVNKNHKWNQAPKYKAPLLNYNLIPSLPSYTTMDIPKLLEPYNYYINGSFYPLVQISEDNWIAKTASYGIYNPIKNI